MLIPANSVPEDLRLLRLLLWLEWWRLLFQSDRRRPFGLLDRYLRSFRRQEAEESADDEEQVDWSDFRRLPR